MASHQHDHCCNDIHFHFDLNCLLEHITNGENNFTADEKNAIGSPQHPEMFLVSCIDSRIQPNKALDYGPGVALEYRPIAAVIPPPSKADPAFLERMAFRRINNIDNILIVCHSDCGGAKTAISIPNPDLQNGTDKDIIASAAQRSGLDISKLAQDFMAAAGNDVKKAGDRLAKEIGVQSMKNILQYKGRGNYKTIGDEVSQGATKIMVVYYDLATRSFEKYDPSLNAWVPVSAPPAGPATGPKAAPSHPAL